MRDLENSHAFIRQEDAAAARSRAAAILRAAKRWVEDPESGPVADDLRPVGSYRHAVVGRHRVIYMLDQDAVVVLRRLGQPTLP